MHYLSIQCFLLVIKLLNGHYTFYETSISLSNDQHNFHCLILIDRNDWKLVYHVEYCIRPLSPNYEQWLNLPDEPVLHPMFTFQELYSSNTTSEELLAWSVPLDLVEQYQDYINKDGDNSMSNNLVYKCNPPWFGWQCRYSLDFGNSPLFYNQLQRIMRNKRLYLMNTIHFDTTCFIEIKCRRLEAPLCLDWREICNGQIDCLDGEDELECSQLELNECSNDEFRCHNGLCISNIFMKDDVPECLDMSDISPLHGSANDYWQEFQCRPDESFVCGDESCTGLFGKCDFGRHRLLSMSVSHRKDLSETCWKLLICLTRITDELNKTDCQTMLQSIDVSTEMKNCPSLTRFPEHPLLSNHIYFLYNTQNLTDWFRRGILIPKYICFNVTRCDHLRPNYFHENLTCQDTHQLGIQSLQMHDNVTWKSIIDVIKPHLSSCLSSFVEKQAMSTSKLYCCRNSSKCISKHRVMDRIQDCPFNDDEEAYELSCTIKTRSSYRCDSEPFCRSELQWRSVCENPYREFEKLNFFDICDRTVHSRPVLIDGKNHTDETDCENWNCHTRYTKCDRYWNCPNGEDELDCGFGTDCPVGTFECVSIQNMTIMCLPNIQISDGIIDCYGGADEKDICRRYTHITTIYPSFLCQNSTKCLGPSEICDQRIDCPMGDDETICDKMDKPCSDQDLLDESRVAQLLCRHTEGIRNLFNIFNIRPQASRFNHTLRLINPISYTSRQSLSIGQLRREHGKRCHRGVSARMSVNNSHYEFICFCPPLYYGEQCQYQTERISLTLMFHSPQTIGTGVLMISLFDDDDELQKVYSYQKVISVFSTLCTITNKFHLLYPTHPKNRSVNYSLRFDLFDQQSLTFVASWKYPVLFRFLPVNSMSIHILLPTYKSPVSQYCSFDCKHGSCIQYRNRNESFCRCDPGWSGIYCQIPINCSACSRDSLCVGRMDEKPICLCPLNKFGRRCLLEERCPEDLCENGGECVLTNPEADEMKWTCICPEHFWGEACQHKRVKLEISFRSIAIPPYVLLYLEQSHNAQNGWIKSEFKLIPIKLKSIERSVSVYNNVGARIGFIEIHDQFYLAFVVEKGENGISTTVEPSDRCPSVFELLNTTSVRLPRIHRVKHYQDICKIHNQLKCFIDEYYTCLCTDDRTTDCLLFNRNYNCSDQEQCKNGGKCFQNSLGCSERLICVCTDCFFGDRCQFYGKGLGLTFDDLMIDEVIPRSRFTNQSSLVKFSASASICMLAVGFLNSIATMMSFYEKTSRQVGVAIYLLASSVTSLLTLIVMNVKFWFVLITQTNLSNDSGNTRFGCKVLEFFIKTCLYTDSWLNACVAMERVMNMYKGVKFNKKLSDKYARWIIVILPLLVSVTFIYEPMKRDVFKDEEENRFLCILEYDETIEVYSAIILFCHMLGPFLVNLLSAIYIIVKSVNQREKVQKTLTRRQHLTQQLKHHKHLIISPVILVLLSIPRLIISIVSGCVKLERNNWLYVIGYFTSFLPSVMMFLIFILPSKIYRKNCFQSFKHFRNALSK